MQRKLRNGLNGGTESPVHEMDEANLGKAVIDYLDWMTASSTNQTCRPARSMSI
jgi:hypothetical protein